MKIVRFRLRTLMIAVAIVGGLLATGIEAKRLGRVAEAHRRTVHLYAIEEEKWRGNLQRQTTLIQSIESHWDAGGDQQRLLTTALAELRKESEKAILKLNEIAPLKAKYERAASRPWETIPPDPPRSW